MLNKVINSVTAHEFVSTAREMVKKYHWEEKDVYPWNYPIKVTRILDDISDYDKCSYGSQQMLESLANGLMNILNSWEEFENEPKVKIMYKGTVLTINKTFAEDFIENGAVVMED